VYFNVKQYKLNPVTMVINCALKPVFKAVSIGFATFWLYCFCSSLTRPYGVTSIPFFIVFGGLYLYVLVRVITVKYHVTITPNTLVRRSYLFSETIAVENIKNVEVSDDKILFSYPRRLFKRRWWRKTGIYKVYIKPTDWPSLVNWAVNLQPQQ
jgi:hypothetical protein